MVGPSASSVRGSVGIHRNAMVAVIDTLERDGFVKRMSHPEDRRAFAVTLTDKARSLLPDLDAAGQALEETVTATLSAADRDMLRKLLQRVAAGAGLIPGVHPDLSRPAAAAGDRSHST
jgi:DNA-binding MarR family transcriptional regulator